MSNEEISEGFRLAMRRLATTVALITAGSGDRWAGMAATAVMSVSVSPPTLLIAVNRNASIHPIISEDNAFCVNLLAEMHGNLVSIFSGQEKGRDRFEHGNWIVHPSGLPILQDSLSTIVCRVSHQIEVSTHTLFIGNIEYVNHKNDINPLIWLDGRLANVGSYI